MKKFKAYGTISLSVAIDLMGRTSEEVFEELLMLISSYNVMHPTKFKITTENECIHILDINDIDVEWENIFLEQENNKKDNKKENTNKKEKKNKLLKEMY